MDLHFGKTITKNRFTKYIIRRFQETKKRNRRERRGCGAEQKWGEKKKLHTKHQDENNIRPFKSNIYF